jgi:HD-GYP domain-containing protein (c-di-GMP phosphodiesterase class II)
MKTTVPNSEPEATMYWGIDGGLWDRVNRSQNILIPIELDKKDQIVGFFALSNQELPEGGQKNLNDITGTPFKAGLAGMTVYVGPILPALQENYVMALARLADSIDHCDQYGHSQQTSFWAMRLAEKLALPEEQVQQIALAGKLHDIGKVVVPKAILMKPGPLSQEEWETIRRHPGYSAVLMEPAQSLSPIRPLVRWHHEHYGGGGYPDGLSGKDIPIGARILAVADAFSTMITGRAYRCPLTLDAAMDELLRCRATQFDPYLVELMFDVVAGI